ncbi:hypothetical protein C9J01_01795 [Photobacterium rosenbergii]|uniref:Pyridoxamine 5'-phosphate oxidase N-terminal domain-containing protein n=1 Tax=Photobacterium rosenbergii TaxID=294936 RepID=A0A2T3NJS6_9GAMM|nr:pyridoxamine 5'-phosphate oxidase family protein [Photobacterium rosenbergii]PSW15774.1 hypothetical protein C9J01_01795 [Photobacterium rosenbergii]
MTKISKEIIDMVNMPGRIGTIATASKQGIPNMAYFGSPQLTSDGVLTMAIENNHTLKNLEENPYAVFLCIAESPVSFNTPGCRLYLTVREVQKEGAFYDAVRGALVAKAGEVAAAGVASAVSFDVTEVRALVDRND